MTKKDGLAGRAFAQIKCFFIQTFRRHTGKEYSEFVTRGVTERTEKFNRRYPWAYVRLFAAIIILLAVFMLIVRFTSNELFSPTVMLLATIAFSLPFLTLLYEIYPLNDLSLIAVVLVMLIGGACACVLTQIAYSFVTAPDYWVAAVYAGVFEEISKAIPVLIIIAALRNKQPLVGFLVGAAVGCGFSIVEDMGYIFISSNDITAVNMTTAVNLFFMRGLTSFCTHIVWTALIGWAFCFFRRALIDIRFYAVVLFSIALHVLWDLPLSGAWSYVVCALCVIAVAAVGIPVLYMGRQRIFKSGGEQLNPEFFRSDEQSFNKRTPEYFVHAGNLSLAIGAFLMAVAAIIYCAIPFRETYYSRQFDGAESFVEFMHDGYDLTVDGERPFDLSPTADNKVRAEDGVVYQIVQNVSDGGCVYHYTYNVAGDSDNRFYFLVQISVTVRTETGEYEYIKEDLYSGGKLYASFFRIRQDVTGFNVMRDGSISVVIYDASFERDLSQPQYTALFYFFAVVAASALISYSACRIKAWCVKRKNKKEGAEEGPPVQP